MREVVAVLDVLCTILESFWAYLLIGTIFDRRFKNGLTHHNTKVVFGFCVLFSAFIVLAMNSIILVSPYTSLAWMLSVIITTLIFWKSDILSALAVSGTYIFIIFIYSNVIIILINFIGTEELLYAITTEQGIERLLFLIIYHMCWGTFNVYIIRVCKNAMIFRNDMRRYAYISLIGVVGGVYFCTQFLISANIHINFMWYIFLLFIISLIYVSYYKIKKEAYEYKTELLMKQTDLLKRNYEQLSEFYNQNAKAYHDMNHHFNAIYHMLEQGEVEQAKEYIENITTPTKGRKIPKRCGIDMLDVVLYDLEQKAENSGISMAIQVPVLPGNINIDKNDLCLLLVNLVNNAIEAAKTQVNIRMKHVNAMLIIEVVNDYKVKPIEDGSRFRTTKADKTRHGWGMQIIEQIVWKYNGDVAYKVKDTKVHANVLLCEL